MAELTPKERYEKLARETDWGHKFDGIRDDNTIQKRLEAADAIEKE